MQNTKKQDALINDFKGVQDTKGAETYQSINDMEKVALRYVKQRVRKEITTPTKYVHDTRYFAVMGLHKTLIAYSSGVFTPKMFLLFCAIAGYGRRGCTTHVLLVELLGYNCATAIRGLNDTIDKLVKYGLVVRAYRRLYISVSAEKILQGKKP